jgi:hypothetical protein
MEPVMAYSKRRLVGVAAMLALSLPMAAPVHAQQVVDNSAGTLDPALVQAITTLATRGFAASADAQLRGIHPSKARNGRGYCGEVAVGPSADFAAFHVIVESDGTGSLLRLSEAETPEDRETAIRLLTNFGCLG